MNHRCIFLRAPILLILAAIGCGSANEPKPGAPAATSGAAATPNSPTNVDAPTVVPPIGTEQSKIRDDNALKMKLVWCPPGEFMMGSPKSEKDRRDDEDQVQVTLTQGFWLGKYEVTQSEWQVVMNTAPWKGQVQIKEGTDIPAIFVDCDPALEFCRKLTDQERQAGRLPENMEYTLPTEAQWEYACRAGTTTRFSFGDDPATLGEYAWFNGTAWDKDEKYAHRVGQKKPNAWGLHDMHGNVGEWCRDWIDVKLRGGTDPEVTKNDVSEDEVEGGARRVRGADWATPKEQCRSAFRGGWAFPEVTIGFRVALAPPGAK